MPRKLLLYLRYDGSHFCGYQAQKNGYSVQQALNEGTEALFGYPCDITGCSRTDSGVHANMFCATVTARGEDCLDTTIPLDRLPRALNIHLPEAVAAYAALWAPEDFHARYSVTSKEYLYRILNTQNRDPFYSGRAWHYPRPISETGFAAMQQAAAAFVGKRDFAACMASGSKVADTTRTVFSASLTREGDFLLFRVRADGFLYNMVRIMVGTLAEVGEGKLDPDSIPARLASLDRGRLGRTAPADGLYLDRVFYNHPEKEGYHPTIPL
ncbi:MAG: tRNA pseudouridine(38-40) synthase TruA [Clostridia bacterium]|nr:tRNA pseudouridine(38-40) synthase TruA [Clostridia bacterium]